MTYIVWNAHILVQALNPCSKITHINFSLKSFKANLFIVISVRNYEFQSEVLLVCLDDHTISAYFRRPVIAEHCKHEMH